MLAGHWLSASVAIFEVWAAAVAGGDPPTSASSAYPHPGPAPWHRSHRAGPTPQLQPTALPAAAIVPHVYFAILPIAAAPALHRPDKAPFPVPCRRASRPWHTLSAGSNRSHARL